VENYNTTVHHQQNVQAAELSPTDYPKEHWGRIQVQRLPQRLMQQGVDCIHKGGLMTSAGNSTLPTAVHLLVKQPTAPTLD